MSAALAHPIEGPLSLRSANDNAPASGPANGNYLYDGNLKRVKSFINDGKGYQTIYNIFDSSGKLVHIYNLTKNEKTDYVTGPTGTIARVTNGQEAGSEATGIEKVTYMHPDHLGSAQAGTNASGEVVWREQYTPFGETYENPAANDNLDGFTGHIKERDKIDPVNQFLLSATGLNYMQARYYDPVIGRFLSIDPTTFTSSGGNPGYFNRYAYTFNDPINGIDPNGETVIQAMFAWNHGVSSNVKSNVHTALDVGGLVPGFGEIADGLNAGLYAAEGDFKNAAISGAALIPVVGSAGTVARLGSKVCCFVAGTLVETEYGLRPIEDLQVGDLVWARDEETGEEALKPVLGLIRLHDRVIWNLETVSETGEIHTFGTTDDHPWWVDGHGWKRTDELSPKDILVTQTGEKASVLSITNTNVIEPTFNIEVADFNTYFVGESKIWVHNACAVSFDTALDKAADFLNLGTDIKSVDGANGVQFIQHGTDAAGDVTKRVGFDVNPSTSHVQKTGPHLNLQTQRGGKIVKSGPEADPHIPIDPSTIKPGDY